ncbi:MAG: ribosomal protein S18 acetylase RimI-like enzyme [Paracoccaceae bacterium]|jgi:ribosomal protein S18 acetylase RimI-like enzyme
MDIYQTRTKRNVINYRLATPLEAQQLSQVFSLAYEPYRLSISDLPDVSGGLKENITNDVVWVAETSKQVVGGIVLVRDHNLFYLADIAVHSDFHSRGIARGLISVLQAHVVAEGGEKIDLATHIDMPENVAIYERLGWQVTGRKGNKVFVVKDVGPQTSC